MPTIFLLCVLFCIWLSYEFKKGSRRSRQIESSFWENERVANTTRKKDIEHLNYITIPLQILPFFENIDKELEIYQNTIRGLSSKKILNLTGLSNTELKKEYGAANLPALTEYDDNFSQLASTIAKWGSRLMELGYTNEAVTVLKFGIECGTDVTANYTLLAKYYKSCNNREALDELTASAEKLNSLTQKTIVSKLTAISQTLQ